MSACAFVLSPPNNRMACYQILYFSDPTLQVRKLEHKWWTCWQSQSQNTMLSEFEPRRAYLRAYSLAWMCYFLPHEIYGAFIRECIQLINSLKLWIVAVNTIWPWSFQELETFWPLNCNLMNGVVQNETPVLEVVT